MRRDSAIRNSEPTLRGNRSGFGGNDNAGASHPYFLLPLLPTRQRELCECRMPGGRGWLLPENRPGKSGGIRLIQCICIIVFNNLINKLISLQFFLANCLRFKIIVHILAPEFPSSKSMLSGNSIRTEVCVLSGVTVCAMRTNRMLKTTGYCGNALLLFGCGTPPF